MARAIQQHFASPAKIARFGEQTARRCGLLVEPLFSEPGVVRLGGWVMDSISAARYTLDLGHESKVRQWIQVELAHGEAEQWRVVTSARGRAPRLPPQ